MELGKKLIILTWEHWHRTNREKTKNLIGLGSVLIMHRDDCSREPTDEIGDLMSRFSSKPQLEYITRREPIDDQASKFFAEPRESLLCQKLISKSVRLHLNE